MSYGDLKLTERLERIEHKIDSMRDDLHSKALDINTLKVKVAVISSVFGSIMGLITAWFGGKS